MGKCECGETMRWNKDRRNTAGGFWRCRVKDREYEASEKGRAKNARYRRTENARANSRARTVKYAKSEKGREAIAIYLQNRGGLQVQRNQMNAWFKKSQKRIERLEKELNG